MFEDMAGYMHKELYRRGVVPWGLPYRVSGLSLSESWGNAAASFGARYRLKGRPSATMRSHSSDCDSCTPMDMAWRTHGCII